MNQKEDVKMKSLAVFLLFLTDYARCSSHPFEFVTDYFIQTQNDDIVAAYGDFNDDKLADVFLISGNGSELDLLLASEASGTFERSFSRRKLIVHDPKSPENKTVITSVMLGDFDGDLQMDVLVTRRRIDAKSNPTYHGQLYWGDSQKVTLSSPHIFNDTFKDEPLVFDYDGDMLPDLLAEEVTDGKRYVWKSSVNRNFTRDGSTFSGFDTPFAKLSSNAFVDVSMDGVADLVLTLEPDKGFEVWDNKDGVYSYNYTYELDFPYKHVGLSSFADYNQDAFIDHLLPVCANDDCTQSKLYIYSNNTWVKLLDNITDVSGNNWGFVPPDGGYLNKYTNFTFPITVRAGDFNSDGFTDIIVILQSTTDQGDPTQRAFFLYNIPCDLEYCQSYGRSFAVSWDTQLSTMEGVIQASFFDLYDDGTLDVIVVALTPPKAKSTYRPVLFMLRNDISGDTCFIKILVATGACPNNPRCPSSRNPYGTNQPGPTVRYKTIRYDGSVQASVAAQLSQSAHFALQLPYTVFGLGQTPNFVDEMKVTIPQPPRTTERLQNSWPQIIPNSQLIVIPTPIKQPSSWQLKLFLTPSKMIYLTGAALIGTCGFVAGIVGILHWREKREDAVEKKHEAQKFHFDAM